MSGDVPDLLEAAARYEAWVDGQIPTVPSARAEKHALMAADPFAFLRGSYFRWVQRVTVRAPQPPGPPVLAVGDLHVENFGTWRDAEGRMVWGINDLDEADRLPAGYDLLRLATSALLAQQHAGARLAGPDVVGAVVDGYARALAAGGEPLVLDRPDPAPLGPLLPAGHAGRWWARLLDHPILDPAGVDPDAVRLLEAALDGAAGPVTLRSRPAGMGSRDHLRIVAIGLLAGAPVVREVKAHTPPATWWLNGPTAVDGTDSPDGGDAARTLLRTAPRSPDTSLRIGAGWVLRRLAPWADRIELVDLHKRAEAATLLQAMGAETANLHLASATPAELGSLTDRAARRWLAKAAERMLVDTTTDWQVWRRRHPAGTAASPKRTAPPSPTPQGPAAEPAPNRLTPNRPTPNPSTPNPSTPKRSTPKRSTPKSTRPMSAT